jgi:hypothetical protein
MGFCRPTVDQTLPVARLAMATRIYWPADKVPDGTGKLPPMTNIGKATGKEQGS